MAKTMVHKKSPKQIKPKKTSRKVSSKRLGRPSLKSTKKNDVRSGKSTLLVLFDSDVYKKLQQKAKDKGVSLAALTRTVMGKQI